MTSSGVTSDNLSVDNFTIDITAPSVDSFTMSDTELKISETATVQLVFSEAVISFSSSADITVANGSLSTMISNDNETWTGIFTPTFPNTEDWYNTLSLGSNWTDYDNNTGSGATSKNYMVDDIYPSTHGSATITLDVNSSANDALLLYNQTAKVTVVFPEPVNTYSQGVDNSTDCNSETGVVSNFTSADFNLDNATGTITSGPTVSSSGRIVDCLGTCLLYTSDAADE